MDIEEESLSPNYLVNFLFVKFCLVKSCVHLLEKLKEYGIKWFEILFYILNWISILKMASAYINIKSQKNENN